MAAEMKGKKFWECLIAHNINYNIFDEYFLSLLNFSKKTKKIIISLIHIFSLLATLLIGLVLINMATFGDYGITGFVAVELNQSNDSIEELYTELTPIKPSENRTMLGITTRNFESLNFTSRSGRALPVNWFVKSEISGENSDSGLWEWLPVEEPGSNILVVDLAKLYHPEQTSGTPVYKIYSRSILPVINASENVYYNLSFDYQSEMTEQCLQVGVELLNENTSPDTTLILNLGQVPSDLSNFGVSWQTGNGWVHVDARSDFEIPSRSIVQLYIAALCESGIIKFRNLSFSQTQI